MQNFVLFLLCNSLAVQAFPVFTFNGTSDSSTSPSFASLVISDINFAETTILCSSVKHARFNDVGFYVISKDNFGLWLTVKFERLLRTTRLTLRWGGRVHKLGKLQNPKLDYWYHVCMRLNLSKNEIEVAVNGVPMGKVLDKNMNDIPNKLNIKAGIGEDSQQFHGSVGNIQLYKEGNVTDISSLPCKPGLSTILPWNPNSWEIVGSDWSLTEEFEEIFCVPSDHYNLAIPLRITIKESMEICQHKLNNGIIPFQQDPELFFKYVAWHKNTAGGRCPNIWTPLSDQNSEGVFLNMNNNVEEEFQPWEEAEPNGGKDENFAMISVTRGVLHDVAHNKLSCSACRISSSLLLQLDGLCEDSIIGKV